MSSTAKTALAIAAGIVVVGVIVWYFILAPGEAPERQPPVPTPTPAPPPTPTPTLSQRLSERLQGVTLTTSDTVVAELVGELSRRPELAKWLAHEDLVRRFVAATANVADGRVPTTHLGFLQPEQKFTVRESGDTATIATSSFERYDRPVELVTSVDPAEAVTLYRELEPLMDEAFLEIARPGADFRDRLVEAIDRVLATPVPEGPIEVEKKVVTWTYADQRLEGLAPIQRLLIRTGPDNAAKIKAWLEAVKAHLQSTP